MDQVQNKQAFDAKDEYLKRLFRYNAFIILIKQFLSEKLLSEEEWFRAAEEAKRFYRIKDWSED